MGRVPVQPLPPAGLARNKVTVTVPPGRIVRCCGAGPVRGASARSRPAVSRKLMPGQPQIVHGSVPMLVSRMR